MCVYLQGMHLWVPQLSSPPLNSLANSTIGTDIWQAVMGAGQSRMHLAKLWSEKAAIQGWLGQEPGDER